MEATISQEYFLQVRAITPEWQDSESIQKLLNWHSQSLTEAIAQKVSDGRHWGVKVDEWQKGQPELPGYTFWMRKALVALLDPHEARVGDFVWSSDKLSSHPNKITITVPVKLGVFGNIQEVEDLYFARMNQDFWRRMS